MYNFAIFFINLELCVCATVDTIELEPRVQQQDPVLVMPSFHFDTNKPTTFSHNVT